MSQHAISHQAARDVYKFMGVENRIVIARHDGGHGHCVADWRTLLDFCKSVFRGKARADILRANPLPHQRVRFGWQE